MADDFSLNAKITADNSGFTKAINQCNSSLGGLGKSLSSLKTLIGGAFAVKTLQTFTKQLNECSRLYIVQAKAEKNLETAAKNNPYLKPENVKQLKSYASQLQSISEIGDEQLLPLMGQLASAGRTQEEIQSIMSAALDASASGAMSLEQAVKSLNMTYSGTAGRLTMVLPNIKNLTEEELKQGKAVEMVANAYKGIAKETANSSKQLANSIGDLKEEIGYGWESALSPMRRGLQEIIDKWSEALRKAREAKAEMTNLENVKVGRGGDIGQASKTQTNLLIQQKIELDEYVRFAQLSAKKKKELTKAEQNELYELRIKYLDNVRALYQGEGETDLQAIQKAVSEKTSAYQKSFEEEKQLVAQHQQELVEQENARTESERQARQNRLNDLRSAFDAELAEYRQEIELRKKTGEKITEEQEKLGLLTVARSAYIKMIQASNGELKEDAEKLSIINELVKELAHSENALTETTGELTKQSALTWEEVYAQIWDFKTGFEEAFEELKQNLLEEANTWSDLFTETFNTLKEVGKDSLEAIGESLVNGEDAWQNLSAVALEAIAKILEGLAAELTARAAVNAAMWNYAGAAAAAAGAAAALVSAGALKAVASNMKKVSKETQTVVDQLKDLKKAIENIQSTGASGGIGNLAKAFADTQIAIQESREAFYQASSGSDLKEAYELYAKAQIVYENTLQIGLETIKETNKSIDDQISAYEKLYKGITKTNKELVAYNILADIKSNLLSVYSEFEKIGSTIGNKITDGIVNGITTSDFINDVESYLKTLMIKTSVYTEAFQKELADSTSKLVNAIFNDEDSVINEASKKIVELYETAYSVSEVIGNRMTNIFADIKTKTLSTITDIKNTLKEIDEKGYESLSDLVKKRYDISSQLTESYNTMLNAEQNYYARSAQYTEQRKAEVLKSIEDIKNAIGQPGEANWLFGDSGTGLAGELRKAKDFVAYAETRIEVPTFGGSWTSKGGTWITTPLEEARAFKDKEYIASYESAKNKITELTNEIDKLNNKERELKNTYSKLVAEGAKDVASYNTWIDAINTYNEAVKKLNDSYQKFSTQVKEQNDLLDAQIIVYRELFNSSNQWAKSAVLQIQLNTLKSQLYSFFEDLQNMAVNVGENLVNSLANGMSQADFLGTMKDYIRKMVIQTVVYTDAMQQEIASIGQAISKGIAEGFTDTGLQEIKRDLSYIFDQANKAVDKVDSMFGTVFSGYATGTENATAGLHLVGEAGPELVRFRGGEQVLNAGDTQKALSGAGTTINQNVTFNNLNDTSAFAMMQQFKRYNREMAINGVF